MGPKLILINNVFMSLQKRKEKKRKKEEVKISFSAKDILFIIERIFRNFESVKHTKKASIFKKPKWIDSVKSCPL